MDLNGTWILCSQESLTDVRPAAGVIQDKSLCSPYRCHHYGIPIPSPEVTQIVYRRVLSYFFFLI